MVVDYIKNDRNTPYGSTASAEVARTISDHPGRFSFSGFFGDATVLVPVPKSSLMKKNTLWTPHFLASAMSRCGLGVEKQLLRRRKAIRTSSKIASKADRPLPHEH